MKQLLLGFSLCLWSCIAPSGSLQLNGYFSLLGDKDGSFKREDLDTGMILFIYLSEQSGVELRQLLPLQDFQTSGFRVVYLVKPGNDRAKIRKELAISSDLFQAESNFYAGVSAYPSYSFYNKGIWVEGGTGLPTTQSLANWVLPNLQQHHEGEQVTLLGSDGFFRQKHDNDCAAAAVFMLLERVGIPITAQEVYQELDRGPGGELVTLLEIKTYLWQLGFDSAGWRGTLEDLRNLDHPAILKVQPEHFVVLSSATKEGVLVLDPKLGRRFIAVSELEKEWKGVYFCVEKSI